MIHLGDITKIQGYVAPTVDCIIGGSPCQDLSLAGKRAGLAGARSGLYMEQIRIIKEMREQDVLRGRTGVDVRPRYMVWENVPGAFSTNQGKDFAAVLEEAIRVAEPEAPNVLVPEKGWPTAGCFMGECWSVAWRVLDAQFWGTSDKPLPQRRRRIALVADFGGQSAPEILFVRKSVSGNLEPGKQERKEAPRVAGEGSGGADCERKCYGVVSKGNGEAWLIKGNHMALACGGGQAGQGYPCVMESVPYTLKIRSGCDGGGKGALIQKDKSATLSTLQDQTLFQPVGYKGANITDMVLDEQGGSRFAVLVDGKSPTLRAEMHGNVPCAIETRAYEMQAFGQYKDSGIASALKARDYKDATDLVVAGVACRNMNESPELFPTLQAKPNGGQSLNFSHAVRIRHIVRRLTPLECERLQGFPDGWTDNGEWVDSKGKKHKEADSPRYKALGNSIAIPPWKWVLKRLCACYERDATMASLFDGIGGFPYIWEQLNGKGSCLWASEIEEFPMAVTKLRFGG